VAQGGLAKAEQTTVEYGDGVLRIEASAENQILGSSGSIEGTVQLPGGSRIEAKAARAEFRAVGRFGDVTFEGSHGSIKLDEAASVRLTTLAGDVSVGRLNGPAEISIGKGDIRTSSPSTPRRRLGSGTADLYTGIGKWRSASPGHRRPAGRAHPDLPGGQPPAGPRHPRAVRPDRQGARPQQRR
jgi:hypothetical protein